MVAVGIYLLMAYPFSQRPWRRTFMLALVALLVAIMLLLPLAVFIIDRSQDYLGRLNQVSIFNEDLPENQTVTDAILQSTVRHLEMFHLHGDNNGRHNLPGEPMLDPMAGSLLVIGLFVALRERRREHLFFAISIGVALLGGILSLSFEAPQSARTIGAITGVIYYAALGLDRMTRVAAIWLSALLPQITARRLVGAGALGTLGIMAAWNFNVYFNLQRTNLAVWREYSTIETLTGRFFASYNSETQFYISPLIGIAPSVQFLAADALTRSNVLVMPDPFPLRIPPTSPTVIMLVPSEDIYLTYLHRLYPNGRFNTIRPVDYGVDADQQSELFTVIELAPEDIGAIQGLQDGIGVLYAPIYDNYIFEFASGARLELDDRQVEVGTPIRLAEGNHRIVIDPPDAALTWQYSRISLPESIPQHLLFHNSVTPNGMVAAFYDNADWEGAPVTERIYPFVHQYNHIIPMDRPYSVRYSGYLYAPETGEYQFRVEAIDTGALNIDGENIIQTTVPNQRTDNTIRLEQGWHTIDVRHQDLTSFTHIYLTWVTPTATEFTPIQREYFCPTADLCSTPDVG
jgi:hypothetical protein